MRTGTFHAFAVSRLTDGAKRYGVSPDGFLVNEANGDVPAGSTRTDHVSAEAGVSRLDEAFPPILGDGRWVTRLPIRSYALGGTHTERWGAGRSGPGRTPRPIRR